MEREQAIFASNMASHRSKLGSCNERPYIFLLSRINCSETLANSKEQHDRKKTEKLAFHLGMIRDEKDVCWAKDSHYKYRAVRLHYKQ